MMNLDPAHFGNYLLLANRTERFACSLRSKFLSALIYREVHDVSDMYFVESDVAASNIRFLCSAYITYPKDRLGGHSSHAQTHYLLPLSDFSKL